MGQPPHELSGAGDSCHGPVVVMQEMDEPGKGECNTIDRPRIGVRGHALYPYLLVSCFLYMLTCTYLTTKE